MDGSRRKQQVRALSLLSGGLDSQLAVCVLRDQGIEVDGVVFESPFFGTGPARKAAKSLGISLRILPFTEDIVALVKKPKHGFGKCMNPCIDCHARMLMRAGAVMEREGYDFLSTGEVLNERPMSQNLQSLAIVARESGYPERILRPLSAQRLPETDPEKRGIVDRTRLLGLEGRTRKPQLELAVKYGLKDIPTPAGGCRLTEPNFARRLKELKEHEGLDSERLLVLLRYGRHFRLGPTVRIIVGRNQADNEAIAAAAAAGERLLTPETVAGPTVLAPGSADEQALKAAAAICARYSDGDKNRPVDIRVESEAGVTHIAATAMQTDEVEGYRV